jgi:hypothetical protein
VAILKTWTWSTTAPQVTGDSINTTTATLTSAGEGNEDAGSITYTVNLSHVTDGAQDFKLTLSNGQEVTITVAAGAATAPSLLGCRTATGHGGTGWLPPFGRLCRRQRA